MSKNISKYGITDGIDPVSVRNAKTTSKAKILLWLIVILSALTIIFSLILLSTK